MKKLLILLLLITFSTHAQQKYMTKTGTVNFEASVPAFEEVSATNNVVSGIIDIESGEFAALALVKGFRFKNALMEEHFNENYAESDLFPKAIFKGTIDGFTPDKLTPATNTFNISGQLTFHGVTKVIDNCEVNLSRTEAGILMEGNFQVKASDFDIEIPKVVRTKIAEEIVVSFRFELVN